MNDLHITHVDCEYAILSTRTGSETLPVEAAHEEFCRLVLKAIGSGQTRKPPTDGHPFSGKTKIST